MKKTLLILILCVFASSVNAQFFEDFENTTGPDAVPSTNWSLTSGNWYVFDNGIGTTERWNSISTISTPPSVYQGLNSAYIKRENIGIGYTSEDYLTTLPVTIFNDTSLRFYTRTSLAGDQGTLYQIKLTHANANPTDPNSYQLIQQWTESELVTSFNTYELKTVDLSAYVGLDVYISFVRIYTQTTAAISGDDWFIDNVSLLPFDDCVISGNCSQTFALNAFLDSNANGVKDNGEVNFPDGTFNYEINNSGTILNGYNYNGSFYIFDNNPSNSYNLSFAIHSNVAPYYACNTTYSNTTLPTGSGTNNYYFPLVITNPYVDASVTIYANGQPRPGLTYKNVLIYKNNGTQPIASGMVSFTKDADVTITNISEAGTTPTADGFSYDFTNLAPFEARSITVQLLVPTIPTVQLGDLLTNSATVTIANDLYLTNNLAWSTQTVVGSYDPNDKMESHGRQIVFEDFTADDYLTYTIRFENTGTANAEFIRIEDALDSQLDEDSFELISASHEVNVRRAASALTFHFYNINLPPSSVNNEDGHGYVQFKIKPKAGFAIGDVIPNTASIFFDYNPPIVTNTFETKFVQALKTSTFSQENVVIYPNPATNLVQVALNNSVDNISSVVLVDILGKTILTQQNIDANQTIINTSSLAKGMYLLKITSETNDSVVKKLIIQ